MVTSVGRVGGREWGTRGVRVHRNPWHPKDVAPAARMCRGGRTDSASPSRTDKPHGSVSQKPRGKVESNPSVSCFLQAGCGAR